jgi:hypothetical protein
MLKFISDKNGVSRAEIEAYYRQGIAGLVAEAVDEEFNKISFSLDVSGKGSYNTVLTRNAQNQYILSYERPSVENDDKTLTARTLEALSSAMSRSGDFTPSAVEIVRTQAALIPAVNITASELNRVKQLITSFYLNPT